MTTQLEMGWVLMKLINTTPTPLLDRKKKGLSAYFSLYKAYSQTELEAERICLISELDRFDFNEITMFIPIYIVLLSLFLRLKTSSFAPFIAPGAIIMMTIGGTALYFFWRKTSLRLRLEVVIWLIDNFHKKNRAEEMRRIIT